MKNFVLITLLLVSCFAISAKALDIPTDCSDLAMLQERWETKYFYDLKFNRNLRAPPKLTCNSQPYKLIKAIWVLENLKNSPKFGNIYERLTNKISQLSSFNSNHPYDESACAVTSNANIQLFKCAYTNEKVWKDSKFYFRALIWLVSTVVHEFRHVELKASATHIECANGDTGGCDYAFDENIETAGSYSYEVLYLRDILNENNFNKKQKKDIELLINVIFSNRFLK